MLSARLKEETKEAHQSLEAVVVRFIKSIRSKEDYVQLLHKFYGFHFPMEKIFDQYFNDDIIPNYSQRRRADSIIKDLTNLGVNGTIPLAHDIPSIDSVAKALGGFYVLEGSTQGGEIVAGMLIKHVGLTSETTSFFNVYGENKKEMWQSFKDKMDHYFEDDMPLMLDVIDAANETFLKFREWMVAK